jgi:hypothetical protein
MQRIWIALGSLAGFGTVAMAAVAAHGLERLDPAALRMVGSAIQMQGWHALALLAAGLWSGQGGQQQSGPRCARRRHHSDGRLAIARVVRVGQAWARHRQSAC